MHSYSVIACRVSPQQKALLTRLVRERGVVSLAIGDGGNDVGMIQEAHVGVGISGREGLQAARAADYSFARFRYGLVLRRREKADQRVVLRFLKRLILVHGRYAYQRTSVIAQYSFYKSAFICLMQLAYVLFDFQGPSRRRRFAFVSNFSGTSLFPGIALMLYNIVFTGLPVMFHVLDKDVTEDVISSYPELYKDAQEHRCDIGPARSRVSYFMVAAAT